jgi:uncharacterized protein (TIGR01777 family)
MKVIIFGGTGFIGSELARLLSNHNYEVHVVSRSTRRIDSMFGDGISGIQWKSFKPEDLLDYFTGDYAIVNLAGTPIGPMPWTKKRKEKILESRVKVTHAISRAVNLAENKPLVILQGSAMGYYGSEGDKLIDESFPRGSGFISEVTDQWENALKLEDQTSTRTIFLRTTIALGKGDGFLPVISLPFKLFFGGRLGSAGRWFSWIHIQDEVEAIKFLLENHDASGVFNLSAPNPVRNKDFAKILGKKLHRPSWFHVPNFLLKLFLGEMADELLLTSQRVIPKKLLDLGYRFKYPSLQDALDEIYNRAK